MSTINFRLASHHRDRALYHAYVKIDEKAASLPDSVRVHAKLFYKRFTELKLTRGDVRLGVTANCIIMACKLAGISRTNAEVADMWGIDVRHVTRTSELVRQTLASDAYRTAHTNTTGTTYGAKPRSFSREFGTGSTAPTQSLDVSAETRSSYAPSSRAVARCRRAHRKPSPRRPS